MRSRGRRPSRWAPGGGVGTAQGVRGGVEGGVVSFSELGWSAGGGWGRADVTSVTQAPVAAGDPAGYAFEGQATEQVGPRRRGGDGSGGAWGCRGGCCLFL